MYPTLYKNNLYFFGSMGLLPHFLKGNWDSHVDVSPASTIKSALSFQSHFRKAVTDKHLNRMLICLVKLKFYLKIWAKLNLDWYIFTPQTSIIFYYVKLNPTKTADSDKNLRNLESQMYLICICRKAAACSY